MPIPGIAKTVLLPVCTLKPRYSEFCDIVNKDQLPFRGFTKHITLDIVNKKGMTDLFTILRFESTCILIL